MQTVYKRASVVTGFLILAALLAANAWFIRHRLEIQIADHRLMTHTEQLLLQLTETELLLDDAETGQRGFLYTGRASYLEPYSSAASEIDRHLQTLAGLTVNSPKQRERLSRLHELAQSKLDELRETISLFNAGKRQEAEQLVLSDRGKTIMDEFRRLVNEMELEETTLEAQHAEAYSKGVAATKVSLYLATAFAMAGLALLAYYILRQMELRERHAAELHAQGEWYRVTLTSIGDAVIATDPAGKVTFLNPVAERLTGVDISRAKGRPIVDVFPIFNETSGEAVENPVEKVIAHGNVIGLANHTVLKRTDGTLIPIEDSAAPIRNDHASLIGVVLVFRDATPEREAQKIVRRAEKLAAASRLAATVAHEINNPLDAVGNLVYLTKSLPGLPAGAGEYLQLAEEQLDRVAHITKQTLAFYRESRHWEAVDLPDLVDSALSLYSNKLGSKFITVEKDYGPGPTLLGSPGELKQVIANLISNAADAVGTHGRVKVAVSALSAPSGEPREGVQLRIEDDGPGIASENLQKIFEPFFTTKADVGTGLGLWVAKEIIERHGGTIKAASNQPDRLPGAVFTVWLPGADGAKASA